MAWTWAPFARLKAGWEAGTGDGWWCHIQLTSSHQWCLPGLSVEASPVYYLYWWSGWGDQVHSQWVCKLRWVGLLVCWRLGRLCREMVWGSVRPNARPCIWPQQPPAVLQAGTEWLESCQVRKDVEVLVNSGWTWTSSLPRWPRRISCIRNFVSSRIREVILPLCLALERPHFEYYFEYPVLSPSSLRCWWSRSRGGWRSWWRVWSVRFMKSSWES